MRRSLAILGAAATLVGVACQPRADDINRVQPGYVQKSLFANGDEYYYRRTIAQSETLNAVAIEGQGDIYIERIKFRIQQNMLVAYKPYEAIPGAETSEYRGAEDFEGAVVAAWPITSHFDIMRTYDPQTGRETNVKDENTVDRPWYEREFMRVDFSTNLVNNTAAWYTGYGANELPVNLVSTSGFWLHQDEAPTDPFASRFNEDYIEITTRWQLGMDIFTCAFFVGVNYDAFQRCGYGEAKVRESFVRIREKSDFIPRDYPDSIAKKGPDGKNIYDPETGEVVREPILDRFGFFRVDTPTYDRGYGYTESGRMFRATIHNIWKKHTDGMGNPLPYAQREPQPIIYYLNAEYPQRWRKAVAEVGEDYNRVFRPMVQDVKCGADQACRNAVPAMFEIRTNDCNEDNILKFVSDKPELKYAVARAVCRPGEACDEPLSKIGIGNLEKVCSSLEAATLDPVTRKPGFEWQRIGDNRFKMVVWLANPQESGWGGYGPMHSDVRTGEAVSATSYIRGYSYEVGAATVTDQIDFINGKLSVEDVIYGQNVRTDVANIRKYIDDVEKRAKKMATTTAGKGLTDRLAGRMRALGATRAERLIPSDPNEQINRIRRIEGTRLESDHLIAQEDLELLMYRKLRPGMEVPAEIRKMASPLGKVTNANPLAAARDRSRRLLGANGFCFLKNDFDPHWYGLADDLKNIESRDARYQIVGERIIKHVIAHELGHNVGLSHNFEGSYDAINYYPSFWSLHWGTDEEKRAGNYDEFRNTSVMEYMSMKGLFSDTLGRYDEAALRFGYVNQVQTFKSAAVDGGLKLKQWRYQNDYTKIPDHLCGGTCGSAEEAQRVLNDREWVSFDAENPPANEVPYLFCDNTYDRRTPFCSTFDYGSNLREIFANYYTMWSKYFYWNNFIRDRLVPQAWEPFNATTPLLYAMLDVNIVNQYLYYFTALDPSFVTTDLGKDMAATVAQGLNMAAEVMATPEPIRACPWRGTNPPIFIPYFFFDGNYCDQYTALNSQKAITENQIQPALGPARPASLAFTDDFVEYSISVMGSYFDKDAVVRLLGLSWPRIFRFTYDLDTRNYQMSLYRLFEPEITTFINRLATFDPYIVTLDTATELGSYWCRDPDNMDQAYRGYLLPRTMLDVDSGTSWPTQPPANCERAGFMYPSLLRNIPFSAMFWSHAIFSSDFDSQLDLGKLLKVYVKGADDDFPFWETLPAAQVCSVQDPITGIEYRAVRNPRSDIACKLVERASDALVNWQQDESNDFARERMRQWFERLEFARDLMRIYNP
jgi:hypothetical protein